MGTGIGHYIPLMAYLFSWVMCLVAFSGRPLLTFYYLIPLLPYQTLREHFLDFPLGGNLMTFLILSVIVGALFHGKRLPNSSLYTIWLVFGLYLYVSMWFGSLLGGTPLPLWLSSVSFTTWKDYMLLPLVMVAGGLVIEDRKALRTLIIVSAFGLLLIDKAALQSSMSRSFDHFSEDKRDGGPLGYAGSNGLAAFLAQFSMFFWAFLQFLKNKRYRIFCYCLVGVTVFATMYTFSRASYIAVLAGAFLLGVLKDRKLVLISIVFLFTWQTLVPTAVTERVNMTKTANGKLEASANERVLLWTAAQDSFFHSPIFGTGYASFQFAKHVDNLKDTHNWYVKVIVETGLVGAIIAMFLIQKMLALSYRIFKRKEDPLYRGFGLALFLTIFANLILTFFGDRWTYLEINGLLWALLGAATRVEHFDESEGHAGERPKQSSLESAMAVNPYLVSR